MTTNDLIAELCQQIINLRGQLAELEELNTKRASEMRLLLDERDFLREQFKRQGGFHHVQD